jgi:NAD(P)-dependent dehydrogenase (short-subunit alcohol dehydrogenase family)
VQPFLAGVVGLRGAGAGGELDRDDAEPGKAEYFEHFRTHNPARRIGTGQDIAQAMVFAMTNRFLTGVTLRVDGGEPLT